MFMMFRNSAYAYESAIFCTFECTPVPIPSVLLSPIPTARLELALPIHSLCRASRRAFLSLKKAKASSSLCESDLSSISHDPSYH